MMINKKRLQKIVLLETQKEVTGRKQLLKEFRLNKLILKLGKEIFEFKNLFKVAKLGDLPIGMKQHFVYNLERSFKKLQKLTDEVIEKRIGVFGIGGLKKGDITDFKNRITASLKEIDTRMAKEIEDLDGAIDVYRKGRNNIMAQRAERQLAKIEEAQDAIQYSIARIAQNDFGAQELFNLSHAINTGKKSLLRRRYGPYASGAGIGVGGIATTAAVTGAGGEAAKHGIVRKLLTTVFNKYTIGFFTIEALAGDHIRKWLRDNGQGWIADVIKDPEEMYNVLLTFWGGTKRAASAIEGQINKEGLQTLQGAKRLVFNLIMLRIYEKMGTPQEGKSYDEVLEQIRQMLDSIDDESERHAAEQYLEEATKIQPNIKSLKEISPVLYNKLFHACMASVLEKMFGVQIPPNENGDFTKKRNCDTAKAFLRRKGTPLSSLSGVNAKNAQVYCNLGLKLSDEVKAGVITHMSKPLINDLGNIGLKVRSDLLR